LKNRYELRLKKVSKKAHEEFNRLFPRSRSKKLLNQHEYTGDGIYNQSESLEHGLINASKISQTIDLLNGQGADPYKSFSKGRDQNLTAGNSMSNINEGVEDSTGRLDKEDI
jgi:hypothetical protein